MSEDQVRDLHTAITILCNTVTQLNALSSIGTPINAK